MAKSETILQDINVGLKTVDEKDALFLNIIGNRILSDITFLEDKTSFLSGVFFKEISDFMGRTLPMYDEEEIISICRETIISIKDLVMQTAEYEFYWKVYYEFETKSREYLQKESEKDSYTENPEYSFHEYPR